MSAAQRAESPSAGGATSPDLQPTAFKDGASVDSDSEPPLPGRPASVDGEHSRAPPEAGGAAARAGAALSEESGEDSSTPIHTRVDSRGLPMFARPGQVGSVPGDATLVQSPSDSDGPVSDANAAWDIAREDPRTTITPEQAMATLEDSQRVGDRRIKEEQARNARQLSVQSVPEEGQPQVHAAQQKTQGERDAEPASSGRPPASPNETPARTSFLTRVFTRTGSFTRTSSFNRTGSAESKLSRTSSGKDGNERVPAASNKSSLTNIFRGSRSNSDAPESAKSKSSLSRWLSPVGGMGFLQEGDTVHNQPRPSDVEQHKTLKDLFAQASMILQATAKSAQNTEWEHLFVSIAGHRDSTISVSADLGETLIRLGIKIEVRTLQETIHKVCTSRGREPDGWHGTGVSHRIPIYNEISREEFTMVMGTLKTEDAHDQMMDARELFKRCDRSHSGSISSSDVLSTVNDLGIPIHNVDEIFANALVQATNDHDITLLDFATFLKIMGLKGSNDDYLDVELEDHRRRLLEALNTFHTFDEDGGGTIDALEIKTTMRAMGQKVSDDELASMIAVADPNGTGEIDFEQFCYIVLGVTRVDFGKWIAAHMQKPISLEQQHDGSQVRRKALEQLCPAAFQRHFDGVSLVEDNPRISSKKAQYDHSSYIPQDVGQYGHLARKHPLLDENSESYKPDFVKRAISRPMSLAVHKDTVVVTCAAFCPSGLKMAVTTSEGCLKMFDLKRPKAKQMCWTYAHDHMALALAWVPDGSALITGGADWTVSMWAGEDLSFLGSEIRHLGYVRCVATSYDGKWAASGSSDLTINLYSTTPFKYEDIKLEGHTSWIRWLHFSHDNNRLISGSDDQTIVIWNLTSQSQMQTLRAHAHTVSAGASLPNNKLFTASFDENVLLWSQDTGLLGYLKVFVAEAFDLPRGDILSGIMSNQRFAKVELGKGQQVETKFKSGRSPQWYEEFDLDIWNVDERVNIEIYDWDKDEQHRFLGSIGVPIEELVYADDGITDREYDLLDEEGLPSKSSISLRFTFRHVRCIGELTVKVEKARNLPRMDTFGLADPFAAVTCGKGTRHKTKVVSNNLNPVWNDEFIFNVEESARELKLVLYDWSFTKEEDFMGQVLIPTSDLEATPMRDEWFKLKDIDGVNEAKGEIKLKIQFIPESQRDTLAIRFRRNPASWPVGEKSDYNHFAPVGQIKFLGRTLLRGKCKHCNQRRHNHTKNLRCDLGTGNYFHSLCINTAGTLMAIGTGDGRIRISNVLTGQQMACWTAHAGPVLGLQFAYGDDRLVSWGSDVMSVNRKDYSHGSYLPLDASQRDKGKRNCVELWFVASAIKALDIWRKQFSGDNENDEIQSPEGNDEDEDLDLDFSLDDDDSDDETLTDEEKEERKKKKEARLAQQALGQGKRRGKGGQHGALPGARVGYVPVYYPPPVLPDGSAARSCLKGRGRTTVLKTSLVWGENAPIHNYPPEHPTEEGGDSEDEDNPKKRTQADALSAQEKRRQAEEKRRERAKARQEAKDAELFGRPGRSAVSRTSSNESSPSESPDRSVSPDRLSSPSRLARTISPSASYSDLESPEAVKPYGHQKGGKKTDQEMAVVGTLESVAKSLAKDSDDPTKSSDKPKKPHKTKKSTPESSPTKPVDSPTSASGPKSVKSERSPTEGQKSKAKKAPKHDEKGKEK